jgi:TetR/AcrR family transcriptional regulator, transcriptional repressor for nem operon
MPRARSLPDEVVLERATHVFWRRGYAGTSLRDLTQATGLSTAALYNRYADKDGLFVEVLRRYAEEGLADRLERLPELGPLDAIKAFFEQLVVLSLGDPDHRGCLLVNTALDGAVLSKAARDLVRNRFRELEAFFAAQLRRAVADGALDPKTDVTAAATALLGSVFGLRVLARLDPDPAQLRMLAAQALSVLKSPPTGPRND